MSFVVISRQSKMWLQLLRVVHTLFAKRLRLGNPWNFKVPALMGVTYLAMLALNFKWGEGLQAFGWSVCTTVGISGFGYLTNDLGDRAADQKAGKPNLLATLPLPQIISLLLLFLSLAILPWVVYFPLNALTAGLLAGEFLLFLLYVARPFRLKERGLLGVLTDALYAHVVPSILATLTFLAIAGRKPSELLWPMVGLGLWQLTLGMRNIVLHQLKDADNDRESALHTWVVAKGDSQAQKLLNGVFVPLEICGWVAFLGLITPITAFPLIGWSLYMAWMLPRQKTQLDIRAWLYRYFDDFYIPVFPLTVLLNLVVLDFQFGILAALHILLFKTVLSPMKARFAQIFGSAS